jgi:ABC-2 type transport system ATP-binding protein
MLDPMSTFQGSGDSAAVIEVEDFSYTYAGADGFRAVDGLTLSVRRGELYALLGTNGAGKTTTLETMEGHREPTTGRVSVFGGSPSDRRRTRPRVGIMLQETGFAADLTAMETLRLTGSLSGRTDDAERVLDAVELEHKRDTRVGSLSGGERRRLDFGSAIWGTPELIFLDEPTTGLDPMARDALWDVVAGLRTAGSTIILTTHYLEEAQQYADRIGLMHHGVLAREGTLGELVAGHPARISFATAAGVSPPFPTSRDDSSDARFVLETQDPQRDLFALLSWADAGGHELHRLGVTTSSLDDVFRTLTHS